MIKHEDMLEICHGDRNAAAFCMALRHFLHLIDDLVDGDREHSQEEIAKTLAGFFTAVAANPFWLSFSARLCPIIVQGIRAWVDADEWAASGLKWKAIASDIFKSYYHEVFYQVAFLTGGWEHMATITKKFRRVNWDNEFTRAEQEEGPGSPGERGDDSPGGDPGGEPQREDRRGPSRPDRRRGIPRGPETGMGGEPGSPPLGEASG